MDLLEEALEEVLAPAAVAAAEEAHRKKRRKSISVQKIMSNVIMKIMKY
jgi:hypothetical protein